MIVRICCILIFSYFSVGQAIVLSVPLASSALRMAQPLSPTCFEGSAFRKAEARGRPVAFASKMMLDPQDVDAMTLASHWHTAAHILTAAPTSAWATYNAALEQAPMLVDTGSASILWALGKKTAAGISKEPTNMQWLANWAAIGVVDGVCTHSWYQALQACMDTNIASIDVMGANGLMTLISSAIYTPMYMVIFLTLLSLFEGKGIRGAEERVRLDAFDLTANSIKLWGPFNAFLFSCMPLHLRTFACMIFHYTFLIGLALWDSSIQTTRSGQRAVGQDKTDKTSPKESAQSLMLRRGRRLSSA